MPRKLTLPSIPKLLSNLQRLRGKSPAVDASTQPNIYSVSHSMERIPETEEVLAYNAPVLRTSPHSNHRADAGTDELDQEEPERPQQSCILAAVFPRDILLLVFHDYVCQYASHLVSIGKICDLATPTGFPRIPLPSHAAPLVLLSSVCAHWRSILLSTPSFCTNIFIYHASKRFTASPRDKSERFLARIRCRTHSCRLILSRSAPAPISMSIFADPLEAMQSEGDGRMGLARVFMELSQHRNRWRDLEVRQLDDQGLFNSLFLGGTYDEGTWYSKFDPDSETVSPVRRQSSESPSEPQPQSPTTAHTPLLQVMAAPILETLFIELKVVEGEPWDWDRLNTGAGSLAYMKRRKISIEDHTLVEFFRQLPSAYPNLQHLKLTVDGIEESTVSGILAALSVLFPPPHEAGGHPNGSHDRADIKSSVQLSNGSSRYQEWTSSILLEMKKDATKPRRAPASAWVKNLWTLTLNLKMERGEGRAVDLREVGGNVEWSYKGTRTVTGVISCW